MQSIDASIVAAVLLQLVINDAVMIAVFTIIAAPPMKYFARQIPFLSCALILFLAGYVVALVFSFGWVALRLGGVSLPAGLSNLAAFPGLFATGWLINRYVARHYGIATKFPSLGFKVMLSLLAGLWILTGIGYGVWYLLG